MILGVLLWKGFGGLSLAVFTEMTPPPGAAGGLLNPIMGSLVMTVLAVAIGTADRDSGRQLTWRNMAGTKRFPVSFAFINDILLSAPFDRDWPVHLRDHGRADGGIFPDMPAPLRSP